MTVTSGISGSSVCARDKRVVFQYPGDTGLVEIPSVVDESSDVPKIL